MDAKLSRWLWLFKWLLLIPHLIAVSVLTIVAVICKILAWFAILFTGKYPKSLFDMVVGVLRWQWRVNFYGYGALGTDKYPPFSMEAGNYPADFTAAYPASLNRVTTFFRLILVIPHAIVLYVLMIVANVFLIVAALALLITGKYPPGIFKTIMGVNRWMSRVNGYIYLLTDKYPPFSME